MSVISCFVSQRPDYSVRPFWFKRYHHLSCTDSVLVIGDTFSVNRKEPWSSAHIVWVTLTETPHQVLLFMINTDHDIDRHAQWKHQVADRHHRGEPDADEDAAHDRVAYIFIQWVQPERQMSEKYFAPRWCEEGICCKLITGENSTGLYTTFLESITPTFCRARLNDEVFLSVYGSTNSAITGRWSEMLRVSFCLT